jgi:hypothetical protein
LIFRKVSVQNNQFFKSILGYQIFSAKGGQAAPEEKPPCP